MTQYVLRFPCCRTIGIRKIDFILFAVYLLILVFSVQLLFLIFQNSKPEWACVSNNDTSEVEWSKNCTIYEQCDKADIRFKSPFYSAVQQLDLVCGVRSYYATLISTLQFVGSLVGATIVSHLSDALGRKPVCLVIWVSGLSLLIVNGFVASWQLLAAVRFCIGIIRFLVGGGICAIGPYLYEILLPNQRIFVRCFFNWGWGRLIMTTVCFFIPHWQHSCFAIACFLVPAILLVIIFLPESFHWLESKKRTEQAESSYCRIQKFNGEKNIIYTPEQIPDHSDTKIYSFRDLFTTRQQTFHSLTLIFMRFAASTATYTSDLNSGNLAGDFFLNQFLFCLFIGFSKIPLFFLDTNMKNFSRRNMHHIPQVCIIICYLLSVAFTLLKLNPISIVAANLVGTIFLEYTWDACCLTAIEGFPTVVRSIGLGAVSFGARIGSIIAPQIVYLNRFWEPAPFAMVAFISFCSLVVSYIFLPETKNMELEDSLVNSLERKYSQQNQFAIPQNQIEMDKL